MVLKIQEYFRFGFNPWKTTPVSILLCSYVTYTQRRPFEYSFSVFSASPVMLFSQNAEQG